MSVYRRIYINRQNELGVFSLAIYCNCPCTICLSPVWLLAGAAHFSSHFVLGLLWAWSYFTPIVVFCHISISLVFLIADAAPFFVVFYFAFISAYHQLLYGSFEKQSKPEFYILTFSKHKCFDVEMHQIIQIVQICCRMLESRSMEAWYSEMGYEKMLYPL